MRGSPEKTDGRRLHLVDSRDAVQETLYVRMLGGFTVSAGACDIEHHEWELKKAANVVKLLALEPRHRLHRERVMDLLWPGLNPKKAANNLYRTLHEARKTLDRAAHTTGYLQLRDEHLILSPVEALWTDVEAFRAAAATARNTREPKAYRRAVDSYSGDLLPEDRYEEWAEDHRRELRSTYLDLQAELAALYEERGEYRQSMESLERIVVENPSHEDSQASLMRLYALSGRRAKALRQYEKLRESLASELEKVPAPEITNLYEQIRTDGLPTTASPPLRPSPPETIHPHNLPTARSSFIGREREITELKRLLDTTRLLTLTGVGGSGKTRLALEVARELLELNPDGAWLVGLSSINDPDLVSEAAAQVFQVREQPDLPLAETLAAALSGKDLLLVLDNCEHVVEAAARLVNTLLDHCPELKVLATSRELLDIESEVSWTVPPLSLPSQDDEPLVEDLLEAESMRLFADRASHRSPGFSLTRRNAETVAKICRRLDGIPLAIELAATRVGVLDVDQISERLEDSLRLLNSGHRTAEPRQQTLRGALDWSHDLLDDEERRFFRRLAVFTGGFTLEAAERVVADDALTEDEVLDLLSSLVDKSLVVTRQQRYRLLEPVRQYAREKLEESGEYEPLRHRHALWCVVFAEEAERELTGSDQRLWTDRLETEHDNLRAALGWTLGGGDVELGLRLAGSLWLFWYTHGHTGEGRRWLELGISRAASSVVYLKARALNGAGWIATFQRDYDSAESLLAEGAALYKEIGDAEGLGACLSNMLFGAVLADREIEDYRWCMDEIDAIKPQLNNSRTLANIMLICGIMKLGDGEQERARSAYQEALGLYREAGDVQGTAMALFNLAFEAMVRGVAAEAEAWSLESLRVSRRQDDKLAIMYGLWMSGCCAAREGLYDRAARLWGASAALEKAHDMRPAPVVMNLVTYEKYLDHARSALGEERLETERRRGESLSLEQAIDYAFAAEEASSAHLTPREKEVVGLVAQGLTNPQISEQLVISERTVHNHVRNIFKKLGLRSRASVAARLEENFTASP